MRKRQKLGELLVAAGIITNEQLQDALGGQNQVGGTLGENMIRLGHVTEEVLLTTLSDQLGIQHANLAKIDIPVSIQKMVNLDTVRRRRVLPIGLEGKRLVLGMVDPTDLPSIDEIEFNSGLLTKPVIISAAHYETAISFINAHGYAQVPITLPVREKRITAGSPIENDIAGLLSMLVSMKGQDLHLSAGAIPSIRIDNEIRRLRMPALKPKGIEEMIFGILSADQKRAFEDRLELDFAFPVAGIGRFRCNVYRQRGSIAFTARHVAELIPTAGELGIPECIREAALKHHGLVLICGPNGHGKSTTLGYMVDVINRERRANVISIEDPIELTHRHKNSNVNQREIGNDTHSFAEGLRHIFRQNPDVIVIGELRDFESISIAVRAAETGHLVLGTLHAQTTTNAIDRIVDIFPGHQQNQIKAQLAESLLMVFCQRLVKSASGQGRVLAWEKMGTSSRVRTAIREGKSHTLRGMMQTNVEELVSIDWSLAELVAAKKIKQEEATMFCDNEHYFRELLKVRGVFKG